MKMMMIMMMFIQGGERRGTVFVALQREEGVGEVAVVFQEERRGGVVIMFQEGELVFRLLFGKANF